MSEKQEDPQNDEEREQVSYAVAKAAGNAVMAHGLDLNNLGHALAASGYFEDARTVSRAIVKVLAGRELGIGPVRAMQVIHFYDGQIDPDAQVYTTIVRRHPDYDYKIKKLENDECVIEFFRYGDLIGESKFNIKDATLAGLTNKLNWKKYPRNMLFARAMKNGVKWYAPDILDHAFIESQELLQIPVDSPQDLEEARLRPGERAIKGSLEVEQEYFDGAWNEMEENEQEEKAEEASRDLYGAGMVDADPPQDAPLPPAPPEDAEIVRMVNQWEEEVLEKLVDFGLAAARQHAVHVMNRSPYGSIEYGQLSTVDGVAWGVAWAKLKQMNEDASSDDRQTIGHELWREDAVFAQSCKLQAQRLLGME